MTRRAHWIAQAALLTASTAGAQPFAEGVFPGQDPTRDSSALLQDEAATLLPFVRSDTVRGLFDATGDLPDPYRRWVWISQGRDRLFSQRAYTQLPEDEQRGLLLSAIPEQTYYEGLGGSWGLWFTRAVDVAVIDSALESREALEGADVLVVGLDTVLAARLFAHLGAHVDATINTPLAEFVYRGPMDTGEVERDGAPAGEITLGRGIWPRDDADGFEFNGETVEFTGQYDLIVAMNHFRKSVMQPPAPRVVGQPAEEGFDLGVSPEELPGTLAQVLKPGGRAVIYNYVPAQSERPNVFAPFDDQRAPFSPEAAEAAGLVVIAHNVDDFVGFKAYAEVTGFTPDLLGIRGFREVGEARVAYTIVEKPSAQ